MHRFCCLLLLIALGVCFVSAQTASADDGRLVMDVTLKSCLFQGEKPVTDGPSLILHIRREQDRWQRVWGAAPSFNVSHPMGRVVESKVTDEQITLKVSMKIQGDAWVPGGRAVYDVTLRRSEDGTLDGSYEGTFRFTPVKGRASGRVHPRQESHDPHKPAEPGEHPRILFRKDDLDALKAKAETPFGRLAVEKMKKKPTAAGLAMLYQLTGEKSYAEKSRAEVLKHLQDMDNGSKMIRSRIWGWRMEQMALAYDMCYDAWGEDFKRKVQNHLIYTADRLFHQHGLFHAEIGWHLASTYPGQILYGTGIAGLALWGEKGPRPQKPQASFTTTRDDLDIAPDEEYGRTRKAPVVEFQSGKLPGEWIFVSGFKVPEGKDALADSGGAAGVRPQIGDKVAFGDRKQQWRTLEKSKKYLYNGQISITDAADRIFFTTSYFFTVIDSDKPRWVRLDTDYGGATVYLAGVKLESGDIFRLQKGLYPMMVVAPITETTPWGKHLMKPHLVELEKEEAEAKVARLRAVHAEEIADYEFDLAEWKRTDGFDQPSQKLLELSRLQMYLLYRETVNDDGFTGSTAADAALEGSSRYASTYRTVFRRDVSPYPDVTHVLPCMMFQHLYGEDGNTLAQDINGYPGFRWDAYHETRNTENDMFAALLPITPRKYRRAMLWGWQRHIGLDGKTGEQDYRKILSTPGRPYGYDAYDAHPLYAFVNYPLDVDPRHPAEVMPKTWASPGYGYYGFRSGWKGKDAFLAQVYAKSRSCEAGQRDNAGTFRLIGLGEMWSHGPGEPGGYRFGENVVLLPNLPNNERGCGKVVYHHARKDGSGVVSINMDEVYGGLKTRKGKPADLYERYGSIRNDSAFEPTGVTGLRSIGVDYSGASGAPCLLVIVDRVKGAEKSLWAWQLQSERTSAGRGKLDRKSGLVTWGDIKVPYKVGMIIKEDSRRIEDSRLAEVKGDTFTIQRGDASLRGTVIAPDDGNIEFAERSVYTMGFKRAISKTTSRAVFASGKGGYFVVITVQKGDAPKVSVKGKGLDAVVTVGGQTVRFDGEKVVFRKK